MDDSGANLAANLKRLREARGLSQQRISRLSGIPRPTWASLESGDANPTLQVLTRAAAGRSLWPPPRTHQGELWPVRGPARSEQRPPAESPGWLSDEGIGAEGDWDGELPPSLDQDAAAVLSALGDGPTHADSLCSRLGLPYRCVSKALLTLCLSGVVVEGPPGHYRRQR